MHSIKNKLIHNQPFSTVFCTIANVIKVWTIIPNKNKNIKSTFPSFFNILINKAEQKSDAFEQPSRAACKL